MTHNSQKIILTIILMSLILAPISSPFEIRKTSAQVLGTGVTPVQILNMDPVTLGHYGRLTGLNTRQVELNTRQVVVNTLTSASTKGSLLKRIMEFALKVAGQALKKAVLDRLVDAIVAYISGQSNVIVADWDKFFKEAGERAAGIAAEEYAGGFLCKNFDLNVRFSIFPPEKFTQTQKCTLQTVIKNIDSFVENFENGGWVGYQEVWYPQNNFYGSVLAALDRQAKVKADAEKAAEAELTASGGFASQRDKNSGEIITPGSYLAQTIFEGISPKKDILGVLTADDIAHYIAAIVNAGVNRLTKMGVAGLKGILGTKTSDFTTTTPRNPCAGLTGDAFTACRGFQNTSAAAFQFDSNVITSQFRDVAQPREEAQNILDQLISDQTEFKNILESVANCKPNDLFINTQLAEARSILEELENRRAENSIFLDAFGQNTSGVKDVGINDWAELAQPLITAQIASDPIAANNLLDLVNQQKTEMKEKRDSKLPILQEQLRDCPFLSS